MSESEKTTETPAEEGMAADVAAEMPDDAKAPAEAPAVESPAAELEKLRAERDENFNRYLRAVADLDNYRRRVAREKEELRQFANQELIESLLPVYEHLTLAIASARQANDPATIAKGVELVFDQFKTLLAAKGLAEINPEPGSEFDPNQHESVGHAPDSSFPEERVAQVVRTGFALNGRVLRPASVLLSSGPAPEAAGAPSP